MFYLIDKPVGISSFDVLRNLRKQLGTKTLGHIGTLDPLASGCLLVASDDSTKWISLLEKLEKTYYCEIRLDGMTESLDLGTTVIPVSTEGYIKKSEREIQDFLLGMTHQTPPKYSALHVNGTRAYELARNGKDFSLPKRSIKIEDVEIVEYIFPVMKLRLRVSSGTYIRTIAHDIATFLGIDGGYLILLRRESLQSGSYKVVTLADAQKLEEFDPDVTLDPLILTGFYPVEKVSSDTAHKLSNGLIPYSFSLEKEYTVGQKILIPYDDTTYGFMRKTENGFIIEKNGLHCSHKIRGM